MKPLVRTVAVKEDDLVFDVLIRVLLQGLGSGASAGWRSGGEG